MRSKVNIQVSVSESNVDHLGVWGLSPRGWGNLYNSQLIWHHPTHILYRSNAHSYGCSFRPTQNICQYGAYYHNKHAKNASLIFASCNLRQAQIPHVEDYFFFLRIVVFSSIYKGFDAFCVRNCYDPI